MAFLGYIQSHIHVEPIHSLHLSLGGVSTSAYPIASISLNFHLFQNAGTQGCQRDPHELVLWGLGFNVIFNRICAVEWFQSAWDNFSSETYLLKTSLLDIHWKFQLPLYKDLFFNYMYLGKACDHRYLKRPGDSVKSSGLKLWVVMSPLIWMLKTKNYTRVIHAVFNHWAISPADDDDDFDISKQLANVPYCFIF